MVELAAAAGTHTLDLIMVHVAVRWLDSFVRRTSPTSYTTFVQTAFYGGRKLGLVLSIGINAPEPCLWLRTSDETAWVRACTHFSYNALFFLMRP
ncbi:hypothetical protein Tco_1275523 [Tanacetum coccineum]